MKDKHYVILGMGISGRSVAKYLLQQGAKVTGCDKRVETLINDPAVVELSSKGLVLSVDDPDILTADVQTLILSPGVPLSHPLCKKAYELNIEVVGEIEFACRSLQKPCIGITGTNGKTTVTSQIAHTLNSKGIKAKALGNIGTPLTDFLSESCEDAIIVLELSSFQLETLQSQVLDAAVFLNLTPDHLDRYTSMEEYGKAKVRIGNCLKAGKKLLISEELILKFPQLFDNQGFKVDVFDGKETTSHLDKLPQHEKQNLAAVYGICSQWGLTWEDVLQAAQTYTKGPHRIEHIATIGDVYFYDDSKGTNVDAVLKAVAAIPRRIILIAGGVPKGAPFSWWKEPFKGKVAAICAIGEAAPQIEVELGEGIPVSKHYSMQDAVQTAFDKAKPGDAILLSPGCASFDMFRDYAHRGEVFQQCVHALDAAAIAQT